MVEVSEGPGHRWKNQNSGMKSKKGLGSSHLMTWQRPRDAGTLAYNHRKRELKASYSAAKDLEHLRRDKQRLHERLRQGQTIIDSLGYNEGPG